MKLRCEHNRTINIHPTDKKTYIRTIIFKAKQNSIKICNLRCKGLEPTNPFSQQAGSWRRSKQCLRTAEGSTHNPANWKLRTDCFKAAKKAVKKRKAGPFRFHAELIQPPTESACFSGFWTSPTKLLCSLNLENIAACLPARVTELCLRSSIAVL